MVWCSLSQCPCGPLVASRHVGILGAGSAPRLPFRTLELLRSLGCDFVQCPSAGESLVSVRPGDGGPLVERCSRQAPISAPQWASVSPLGLLLVTLGAVPTAGSPQGSENVLFLPDVLGCSQPPLAGLVCAGRWVFWWCLSGSTLTGPLPPLACPPSCWSVLPPAGVSACSFLSVWTLGAAALFTWLLRWPQDRLRRVVGPLPSKHTLATPADSAASARALRPAWESPLSPQAETQRRDLGPGRPC